MNDYTVRTSDILSRLNLLFPEDYRISDNYNNIELSIGEQQRVALARVFLLERSLIILDEPTSSVDKVSEESIIKIIQMCCDDKITIIATHNQNVLNICDTIINCSSESSEVTVKEELECGK